MGLNWYLIRFNRSFTFRTVQLESECAVPTHNKMKQNLQQNDSQTIGVLLIPEIDFFTDFHSLKIKGRKYANSI